MNTTLFNYFYQRLNINTNQNTFRRIETVASARGNVMRGKEIVSKTTDNDIICGKSFCGKEG